MQYFIWGLKRIEERRTVTSLSLLVMLLLMQPGIQLAFWAAVTHCWLMTSFSSTGTPKSFSSGLLPTCSPPSLCLCLELPRAGYGASHLALLNFLRFS